LVAAPRMAEASEGVRRSHGPFAKAFGTIRHKAAKTVMGIKRIVGSP
jgi:hypothetical protein